MPRNLLQICEEALEFVPVDPPSTIVGGSDLGAALLAIAHATGQDIAMRHEWEELITEATFSTVATETQVTLSSDFPYLRKIIPNTMWNRTQDRRVRHLSAQAWQRIKSDTLDPATLVYRQRGGKILFPGTPTASETVAFEYIDTRWVQNAAGDTYYERFQVDTDTPRIDDYAMILGVRWRYLQAKGMEYGEAFRMYEDRISNRRGEDEESETLSLNPYSRSREWDRQVPDGNWNQ